MATETRRGSQPIELTVDELQQFNRRYSFVVSGERGRALIVDNHTGERLTPTQFRRLHGVRADLWLASGLKPTFTDVEAIEIVTRADADDALPRKNPYRRRAAVPVECRA